MTRRHRNHDAHVRTWQRWAFASHVALWARFKHEQRRCRIWYRGKVSRMTQFNHPLLRGDRACYAWLKDYWRRELVPLNRALPA